MAKVEVLGVRHHGPGSARSVLGALAELRPDLVVIEGPPELDALLPWAGDPGLVPPVAGLVYAVDDPRRSSFYPLAAFSPEWVALRWATAADTAVRFADLPAVHDLAGEDRYRPGAVDPIAALAAAAGYDDAERWWEDAVEHRATSSLARFALLREAMAAARSEAEDGADDLRREAAMRRVLRAAVKEGYERIAVVCGAFHAPALDPAGWPSVAADHRLLSGLPRTKVAATWAPWTAGRLALASGYGAGVRSPGWYQHLFTCSDPDEVAPGWLTRVARALRAEGLPAAPATVVEAVRLAEALAAVRGRPSVGLSEVTDATQTVLCEGSALPLALIDRTLVIGEELGEVPGSVPLVPLAQDLARRQRSLRLKPSPTPQTVVLDLRKEAQLERSLLLHRLALLGIDWGVPADAGRTAGTFKEAWELTWRPEFAVRLIEAGLHGTTVTAAAEQLLVERAAAATALGELGGLLEQALVADLPDAVTAVVDALAARTAHQHDTQALLEAVEPLARTQRYGDVRRADVSRVRAVLETIVLRAAVELRSACAALDDEAAATMRAALDSAHRGITLVDAQTQRWHEALASVAADERIHGSVAGRANRLLLDAGRLDSEEAARRLSRQLSPGARPTAAAAWLDGFLEGEAVLLLHDPVLLGLVDSWIGAVEEDTFEDLLPLLRRTFARFEAAERRQVGERVRIGTSGVPAARAEGLDLERALPAAHAVARLIGLEVRS
ncbi:DUF5682 family protein [Nocardioides sp. BP30]|uniref:DUF5682 family protein n=1 Tax=Nocardioides sp. BP30 TaxID=3036374 RepID=UPI002468F85F|nr:DUF5682 family protein [Nocardioides sp. BP30]WGL52271.1 DUF5682 family protein [Nocardioides sp. BP30]